MNFPLCKMPESIPIKQSMQTQEELYEDLVLA